MGSLRVASVLLALVMACGLAGCPYSGYDDDDSGPAGCTVVVENQTARDLITINIGGAWNIFNSYASPLEPGEQASQAGIPAGGPYAVSAVSSDSANYYEEGALNCVLGGVGTFVLTEDHFDGYQ